MKFQLNKKGKVKLGIALGIAILVSFVLFAVASPNQPPNSTNIGYEYLDNNSVLHFWNEIDDYYIDVDSGMQLTNHYNNYWSHNVFCGGINLNNSWEYICVDSLPFNWTIDTDNATYFNYTGYRDVIKTVNGNEYKVRFELIYNLRQNQSYLNVQPYYKNIGANNIPVDVGFAWKIKDIQISMDSANDYISVNNSNYFLNETLDLSFSNLNNSEFYITDLQTNELIWMEWDKNLDYLLKVKSESGQANAPITLGINGGSLAVNQEKTTIIKWIDATPCGIICTMDDPIYAQTKMVGDAYTIAGEWSYNNGTCNDVGTVEADYKLGSSSTWNALTSTTNLSTTDTNPQGVEGNTVGYWSVTTGTTNLDIGVYNVSVYCGNKGYYYRSGTYPLTIVENDACDNIASTTTFTSWKTKCQNITASNVIIDCNNLGVNATNSALNSKYGFVIEGKDNITIKNCIINNTRTGIYVNTVKNFTAFNNTIINTSYTNTLSSANAYGIRIYYSNNTNITNNNLVNTTGISIGTYSGNGYGISIDHSNNSLVANNVINRVLGTPFNEGGTNVGEGIYLTYANFNNISKNSINNTWADGLIIGANSKNNTIQYNLYNIPTGYGIYLLYIENLTLQHEVVQDDYTHTTIGISLGANPSGSNIINNISISNITSGAGECLYFSGSNINLTNFWLKNCNYGIVNSLYSSNSLINSTITNTTTNDYYGVSSSAFAINNIFLNVTFNKSKMNLGTKANLTVQWYSRVNVTSSTGSPLPALVMVNDSKGNIEFNGNAGADGLTDAFISNDAVLGVGNTTYNNHTINASYSGYANSLISYNISSSGTYPIVLGIPANESSGRNAIEEGINNIIPGSTVYTDLKIDIRYFNGTQTTGTFDKVAFYNNQRWAFNYVTSGESYTNMFNSSYKVLNVWENSNMSYNSIVNSVQNYINGTFS
jgi:parallel beta-helix repeat protein